MMKVVETFEKKREGFTAAEQVGFTVLLRALEKPLRQIAENAGYDPGVAIMKVIEVKGNAGYDAVSGKIVPDMVEAGIVDPVKVTRTGLERAASAAAMLLTTEAAVAEEPQEKNPSMGGGIPGGMGGMGDMEY
jgi:chaperonin GroEL